MVIATVALLVAIPGGGAVGAGGSTDFGDAPDGASAGYRTAPGVTGRFPSKAASGGPRHSGLGQLRIGPGVDGERDSEQVDRDRHDDGLQPDLRACKTSKLRLGVDATRVPGALRSSGHVVYVNAWFDWNRDGDWEDTGGCAPEWGIKNLPLPASVLTNPEPDLLEISLLGGAQVRELWYRVTITHDEPVMDPSGRGTSDPFARGETEDELISPQRKRKRTPDPVFEDEEEPDPPPGRGSFSVTCDPPRSVILHGSTADVGFAIKDSGKGFIRGEVLGPKPKRADRITLLPSPNQRGVPPGFTRATGMRVAGGVVDPPRRIVRRTVGVRFSRGKRSVTIRCIVLILHNRRPRGVGPRRVGCRPPCRDVPAQPPPPANPPVRGKMPPAAGAGKPRRIDLAGRAQRFFAGIRIPLSWSNPTPRKPPKLTGASRPTGCAVAPATVQGGPAVLVCRFAPIPPGTPLDGTSFELDYPELAATADVHLLDETGAPFASLRVGPDTDPPVGTPTPDPPSAQSAFLRTMNPSNLGFQITFNRATDRFTIVVPNPFSVQGGAGPPGGCVVAQRARPQDSLVCTGNIPPGQRIDGAIQLSQAAPNDFGSQVQLLGMAGASEFGPFSFTGPGPG